MPDRREFLLCAARAAGVARMLEALPAEQLERIFFTIKNPKLRPALYKGSLALRRDHGAADPNSDIVVGHPAW